MHARQASDESKKRRQSRHPKASLVMGLEFGLEALLHQPFNGKACSMTECRKYFGPDKRRSGS
jgi:hypothetical protein